MKIIAREQGHIGRGLLGAEEENSISAEGKGTRLSFVPLDLSTVRLVVTTGSYFANAVVMKSQLGYVLMMADETGACNNVHYGSKKMPAHRHLRDGSLSAGSGARIRLHLIGEGLDRIVDRPTPRPGGNDRQPLGLQCGFQGWKEDRAAPTNGRLGVETVVWSGGTYQDCLDTRKGLPRRQSNKVGALDCIQAMAHQDHQMLRVDFPEMGRVTRKKVGGVLRTFRNVA